VPTVPGRRATTTPDWLQTKDVVPCLRSASGEENCHCRIKRFDQFTIPGGVVVAIVAPVLTVVAALAALASNWEIEIHRSSED
jgi:hypothetical protein